ncbi:MAG: undecaprenyl-diphosphate phosphatase, partial [Nanopusillaceae archaeon]
MEIYPIILGLIQGVTEWLPISSKTQILLASVMLFNLSLSAAYVFGLFMEIGTILSALIYFRDDIIKLLKGKEKETLKFILISTIFTGIVGVALYYISKHFLETTYNPGLPMFILGIILILNGFYIMYSKSKSKIKDKEMNIKDSIIIGLTQGISALPGISRSGITVSTMLLLGYRPEYAFRYSYLLYIPAAIGAFLLSIVTSEESLSYIISNISYEGILLALITS